ncbi:MAG: ATP-binding protein [Pseudoprimorskyibacter sp.]|nr:ATP-binding protein [Pseudoprimorskyibacter sp.]
MCFTIWAILARAKQDVLHNLIRVESEAVALVVERDLSLHLSRLTILARNIILQNRRSLPMVTEQTDDFDPYQNILGHVAVLDAQGFQISGGHPEGPSNHAMLVSPDILALARQTAQPILRTRKDQLLIKMVLPTYQSGVLIGFLVTELMTDAWINDLLLDPTWPLAKRGFSAQIFIGDEVVFRSQDFDSLNTERINSDQIRIFNTHIRSELRIRPNELPILARGLPEIVAILLFMAGSFGIWAQYQRLRAVAAEKAASEAATALRSMNAVLRAEVDVRRRAETQATRAQEASAIFLATMSHEIRTPLNAIMGMFELIERADVTPRVVRQAQAGRSSAMRLFSELTNVLDASRLDAGALTVNRTNISVKDFITRLSDSLVALCDHSRKPVEPVVEIGSDMPDIAYLDIDRMTKILTNLMDNALKFTTEGQVAIRINKAEGDLLIRVADTGIGIPRDRRAQLFQRFYQIDDGRSRSFDGAGLGLAISREIAELTKSELLIEHTNTSLEGGQKTGTVFRLTVRNAFPHSTEHEAGNSDAA